MSFGDNVPTGGSYSQFFWLGLNTVLGTIAGSVCFR